MEWYDKLWYKPLKATFKKGFVVTNGLINR